MFKQSLLEDCPVGSQKIGPMLSLLEKDDSVTYFLGSDNYFSHPQGDEPCRRFVLASLMVNGHVRARDLEAAPLVIPHRTLMNWVSRYRKEGSSAFFRVPKRARPPVMSADKSAECAGLLADGIRPAEVARRAGIDESTLRKAIKRKALPEVPRRATGIDAASCQSQDAGSTKAERSREDAQAATAIGTACTRLRTSGRSHGAGAKRSDSIRARPGCSDISQERHGCLARKRIH